MPKVQPGQKWKPPLAVEHNSQLEASEHYQRRERLSVGGDLRFVQRLTDIIEVKNSTGANLRRGEVVEVGAALVSAANLKENLLFDCALAGNPPAMDSVFAICKEPIPIDQIGTAHVSGACWALVDINHESHPRAKPANGDAVLQSAPAGPWRILYQPSGTGEKECVLLYTGGPGPCYVGKTDGSGITAVSGDTPGSGTVTLYKKGTTTLSSLAFTDTIYNSGLFVPKNTYVNIFYDEFGIGWVDGGVSFKPTVRFTLAAALATTDASKTGTITQQIGQGINSPDTGAGAINVHNLPALGGGYTFEGATGTYGLAAHDSGNDYHILQMNCPPA